MVKLHPLADLGACRLHTRQVAEEFVARFPILQSWAYNPASHGEHGEGRALDLMVFVTDDQEIGPAGRMLGDRIFDAVWRDRVRLGVEYIIWNRHIISTLPQFQPGVLRPYSGDNPHTDHVHTTFLERPPTYKPEPPAPVIVHRPSPPTALETPMRRDPLHLTTATTPPQQLEPKAWTRIRMSDAQVAISSPGMAPCLLAYDAWLSFEGVPPGTQIQVRTYTSKATGAAEDTTNRTGTSPVREFIATGGVTFAAWSQVAQELEADEWLRVEVLVFGAGATVTRAASKVIFWKGA